MTSARPCPSNTGSGNNLNLLNSLRFLFLLFFSFLSLGYLKMWPLLVSVHQPRSCDDIAAAGHPHKPTLVITKLQKNKKQPTSKQMKWTYLQLHLEISDTCSEPVSSNSILVHEWCCQSFVRSLLPFNSEMKARKSIRSSILTGFFSKVSISQPLFEVQW